MQVTSLMTDLINIKDEIFKKVRLLESKLINEVNTKYSEMHTNFEKLENRLNFISENNDSLLELVTAQKVNLDKIKEFDPFKNKIEHNITLHDIKIKTMSSDIDKIKLKYDQAIYENLQVPGYVGPGCQFKTISEYISNNVLELSKLKNDRDQMKIENIEVKNRLDNVLKSTLKLVDNSIIRCQNYSDNKHKDMQNILNLKLVEISEKNMDIRSQISKTDIKYEKQIENLKIDVEKLLLMKNDLITLTEQKIEEINKKIEEMSFEMNLIKAKKKDKKKDKDKEKEKEINNINNSKLNDYNKGEINENINININNITKGNFKLQKNPMIINSSNYNVFNNINDIKNVNMIKNHLNNNNNNSRRTNDKEIIYNNELKRENENKEEEKLNLPEKDYS